MARILDFLLHLVKVTGESLAEEWHDLESRTDELKTHCSPLVSLSFHVMSLYVDCIFQRSALQRPISGVCGALGVSARPSRPSSPLLSSFVPVYLSLTPVPHPGSAIPLSDELEERCYQNFSFFSQ